MAGSEGIGKEGQGMERQDRIGSDQAGPDRAGKGGIGLAGREWIGSAGSWSEVIGRTGNGGIMRRTLSLAEMRALDALVKKAKPGRLLPEQVVKAAREKDHPLHRRFDWNVKKAAMRWWLEQARDVIQVYVTSIDGDPRPVRALVSVATATGDDGYLPIREALNSAETLAELRRMFARDLNGVLKRYEYLRARLPSVFSLIERVAADVDGNGGVRSSKSEADDLRDRAIPGSRLAV